MSSNPHILFVDDESNILQGLRRGLRSQRKIWDMSFAHGPEEALDLFKSKHIDVVVTDMRMPKMDGARLLEEVCKLSPDTARIILSGYSEEETILRAVGPAHQYLAKPCDFDFLIDTLKRIVCLRETINNQKIREVITGTTSLPSLPNIYNELLRELENERSTAKTIAPILDRDIGLKTQVLKVCNSAFFSLPHHVENLESAVSLLGINTLRSMALLNGIFTSLPVTSGVLKMVDRLCTTSMETGMVAQLIAQKAGLERRMCDLASSAGTLSHIGTLLVALLWPKEFEAATNCAESSGQSIDTCERDILGTDHAAIGAYFLGLWGFPLTVCEAVAFHHRPRDLSFETPRPVLASLHIAQLLTKVMAENPDDIPSLEDLAAGNFLESQGLSLSDDAWTQIVQTAQSKGD